MSTERGGVLADGIVRAAPRQLPPRQRARMIFEPKPAIIGHRDALSVDDVQGVLATLAGDAPPRRLTEGSNGE